MEKFYLEELSILRKNEFIDYLNEFVDSYNKEYIINNIVNKNSIKEVTGTVDWLKPSTWGLKEKITIGVLIVLVMVIITAVVMKIKLARNEEDDLDLPGAEELDKALAEHQELAEDIIAQSQNQQEELVENEQDDDTNSDIEKAQEYFELYSKRTGFSS